jgi:hypothetical protein
MKLVVQCIGVLSIKQCCAVLRFLRELPVSALSKKNWEVLEVQV